MTPLSNAGAPDLTPIPTTYAGCRFRSRLEARWAVVFDQLGIGWEYEPEAFHTSAGPYLPDFRVRIPQIKASGHSQWFEVKPPGAPLDRRHAALATDSGQPLIVARGLPRDQLAQLRRFDSPLMAYGGLGADETTATAFTGWPVALIDPAGWTPDDLYCSLGDNRHWCQEDVRETLGEVHLGIYGTHGTGGPNAWLARVPAMPSEAGGVVNAAFAAARSARFDAH
jgi:hypothetical protein